MRNAGRKIAWSTALVVVVAVVAAGTACTRGSDSTQDSAGKTLNLEQLMPVLVPLSAQPETRFVRGPMTLKQAAEQNAFKPPPSIDFEPEACASYLFDAIGPLDANEGWVQFGSRVHKDHNDNFIQAVATIPGATTNKVLDKVREALSRCKDGTVTLDGKVTGKITYEERTVPDLRGLSTFAITGMTTFSERPGTAEAKLVQTFEMPPDSQLLLGNDQTCVEAVNISTMGNTLILVSESDVNLANQLTMDMFTDLEQALK